jgi:hypothetical protein
MWTVSRKISRLLAKYSIKMIHQPVKDIYNMLRMENICNCVACNYGNREYSTVCYDFSQGSFLG